VSPDITPDKRKYDIRKGVELLKGHMEGRGKKKTKGDSLHRRIENVSASSLARADGNIQAKK